VVGATGEDFEPLEISGEDNVEYVGSFSGTRDPWVRVWVESYTQRSTLRPVKPQRAQTETRWRKAIYKG